MGGLVQLEKDWDQHCSIWSELEADFHHHYPCSTSGVWDWVQKELILPRHCNLLSTDFLKISSMKLGI